MSIPYKYNGKNYQTKFRCLLNIFNNKNYKQNKVIKIKHDIV